MNTDTTRARVEADRLADAVHRLLLATEGDDPGELDAARKAAMAVHAKACDRSWDRMSELVPAWFVERMKDDVWPFGLLLVTGGVLAIETVVDVTQAADGSLWLDVRLLERFDVDADDLAARGWAGVTGAPTSRTTCSVALAHVVCAVELADT